jgi:hypothetical protein
MEFSNYEKNKLEKSRTQNFFWIESGLPRWKILIKKLGYISE